MQYAAERAAIVETARQLHRDGLVVATAGNVSVRVEDGLLITPSGVDYQQLTVDDVVQVRGAVWERGRAPSSELPLHQAIYAATDVGAIVHTHSMLATAVGAVCQELPAVHYVITALGGPVRVAPYALFGSAELAAHVVEALAGRSAALMRNHGAVTTGADLVAAYRRCLTLEWLAELYWRARQLGEPAVLDEAQLAAVTEQVHRLDYPL